MEALEDSKISPESLCKLLEGSPAVLLLDLRSFMLYNQAHAKQALNVCIPKTLAKRQGFTVESISAGICKKADKDEFKKRKGAVVVLYDQNGTDRDPCSLLCKCFDALLRESLCMKVYWLEGGFTRLQNQAPELIRTSKVSTILKPLTSPKSTRPLFPPLAAMTAPADLSAQNETIVQITDHLFLSGSHIAEDYETLKAHNIRYIINAAVEIRNCFGNLRDFVYKRLDLQDHPAQHMCFVEVFESAFKAIDEAKANNVCALVHCRGGRSRSATIVIAYLMKSYNWTLQQAYGYVQAKHPKVSPNLGFMGQLVNYEAFLRGIRGDLAHSRSPMKIVESPFQIQYLGSPQEGHLPARSHSPSTAEAITSMSSVTLDVQS